MLFLGVESVRYDLLSACSAYCFICYFSYVSCFFVQSLLCTYDFSVLIMNISMLEASSADYQLLCPSVRPSTIYDRMSVRGDS